jgi:hypothetical protein
MARKVRTVHAFEFNMADMKTLLPVIEPFMAAHQPTDVTAAADQGTASEAYQ